MLLFIGMLLAGLMALFLAGDWLVRGAVAAALKLGVSRIIASIVIIGFGTSAPEMLVAVQAVRDGTPGLAIGNLIGSNIVNILLVLGLPALFVTMRTSGEGLLRSVIITGLATTAWIAITPFTGLTPTIGAIFLGVLLAYILSAFFIPGAADDDDLDEAAGGENKVLSIVVLLALLIVIGLNVAHYMQNGAVTREGIIPLVILLAGFILLIAIPDGDGEKDGADSLKHTSWPLVAGLISLGIIGLPVGAHFTIMGANGLATYFELPSELIGLTIMAIGTSLPELGAAVAATVRRENDVVLGNVAGSNLFNLLGAGGLAAIVPWFTGQAYIDMPELFLKFDHWVMGGVFALFLLYVLLRKSIGKVTGFVFLAIYVAYLYGIYHFHNLGLGWSDLWI